MILARKVRILACQIIWPPETILRIPRNIGLSLIFLMGQKQRLLLFGSVYSVCDTKNTWFLRCRIISFSKKKCRIKVNRLLFIFFYFFLTAFHRLVEPCINCRCSKVLLRPMDYRITMVDSCLKISRSTFLQPKRYACPATAKHTWKGIRKGPCTNGNGFYSTVPYYQPGIRGSGRRSVPLHLHGESSKSSRPAGW